MNPFFLYISPVAVGELNDGGCDDGEFENAELRGK